MAAMATPTTTVRAGDPDAPDAPEVRGTAVQDTGRSPGQSEDSLTGFDDLFVHPVDPGDHGASLPRLSDGWRHAGLVELVARQPRERRETILAGAFALAAVLWAPLGVFAFMTRNGLLFGAVSLAAAVLAAAPRPVAVSQAAGDLVDRVRPALGRVRPALGRVRPALARVRPVIASTRERLAPVAASLRERLAPLGQRLRTTRHRVAAALRTGAQHVAARLRAADHTLAAAVRRGLEGLHRDGGDHSTPSSAR